MLVGASSLVFSRPGTFSQSPLPLCRSSSCCSFLPLSRHFLSTAPSSLSIPFFSIALSSSPLWILWMGSSCLSIAPSTLVPPPPPTQSCLPLSHAYRHHPPPQPCLPPSPHLDRTFLATYQSTDTTSLPPKRHTQRLTTPIETGGFDDRRRAKTGRGRGGM